MAFHPLYLSLRETTRSRGEYNDCTVKALAIATGLPYDDAHKALADLGRKPRRGCYWHQVGEKAANALGFNMRQLTADEYNCKTIKTAGRDKALSSGVYTIHMRGHVAAMIDGEVIDHTADGLRRIQYIHEFTKAAPIWRDQPEQLALI